MVLHLRTLLDSLDGLLGGGLGVLCVGAGDAGDGRHRHLGALNLAPQLGGYGYILSNVVV